MAQTEHVNVLLVGSTSSTAEVVDALWDDFDEPIFVWRPGCRLFLPPSATGTLVLRDVGAMTRRDHTKLCEWLEATAGRIRVVSTTVEPLLLRVKNGTFPETLYYRLNVLCFELSERDP